jgi:GTP pyrophosphokinase
VVARIALQCARLRAARDAEPALRQQLAAESRAVFAPLANRLGIWQLKWELEDLAFRWLEPDAYREIAAALAERRSDRERWVVEFVARVADELKRAGLQAEVYGRPKHIYSIWRKMQRKQLALAQLFDLRAIRIVCANVPDCYAALGVVHSLWTYIPGEFDDYIATPKDNFYRSIHTAVIGPGELPVEVQIRTRDMHEHAELGVAAHWRYKEGGARDTGYERKIEWVRRLLDVGDSHDGDQDFIERVRGELFEDRIYALTPRGEVVDLPRDATPLDFAYHVHTGLGHRCRGAKVNGRIVPLTQPLANGEIVEIITGKAESPSRDWLAPEQGFLVSQRSRAKVRAWFRKLDAGDNREAGHQIVERELARLGAGSDLLSALVGEFKCGDGEALYRLVGEGEISTQQLSQAIARRLAPPVPIAPPAATRRKSSNKASGANPLEIEGVGDLPMTLARCCTPMRPQPVVGYVTLGRGVTVHAADCASLARMRATRPERVLDVRWRGDDSALQSVEITVTAWDRRGLVRDLSDVLAAEELSIESLNTTTQRGEGTARSVLRVGVRDLAQLARVVATLARVPNVTAVRRSG